MLRILIPFLTLALLLIGAYVGARRFDRRQRTRGRWEEYGPPEETEKPPNFGAKTNDMGERLEVTGRPW